MSDFVPCSYYTYIHNFITSYNKLESVSAVLLGLCRLNLKHLVNVAQC